MLDSSEDKILQTLYNEEKIHKNSHPESKEVRTIIREIYIRAINNYNQGRYFSAIEAFEEVWLITKGQEKLFYQALITTSKALLRWSDKKPRGAILAYQEAKLIFPHLPKKLMGMNIPSYEKSLDHLFQPLLKAQGQSQFPAFPKEIPPITLEYKNKQ
jgi:hypothetical protein